MPPERAHPPIAAAVSSGYEGGSLARQITSHDIAPIESLIAQRGRDEPLQEEAHQDDGLRHRRTDTQETHVDDKAALDRERGGVEAKRDAKDTLVFDEEGAGQAPEWTFPDGGWKAWSVVLVRRSFATSSLAPISDHSALVPCIGRTGSRRETEARAGSTGPLSFR